MDISEELPARFPHMRWERDFSLARHTTIGCGGTARLAVSPLCTEDAAELLCYLSRKAIPYCFLGAGANSLPSGEPFEGVVVRFSGLKTLFADGETLYAGAGVTGGALLRFAEASRLGGLEPLTGIPMTVGGGVVMNAGVKEGHLSDSVLRVVGIERGKIRTFEPRDCAFSEKRSVFQSGIAVTGVYLQCRRTSAEEIAERREEFRKRRRHLPAGRSMGCVFVNPAGETAGRLIERCGLKGVGRGGAVVSPVHANFILNEGGSAQDVSALIGYVEQEVFRQTGITLREEICRLP